MIRFRTLGTVDLLGQEGVELRPVLAQPRRLALFAYLALARPRGFHRRDSLLAMFWPESDQERGRNALRQAVHFLRHTIGNDILVNRGTEEVGIDHNRLWCDAIAFETALDQGEPLVALEAYGGELLRGFFVADAPEFERWLEGERARVRDRATQTAWALADRSAADGQTQPAAHWARWAVAQEPDNELGQRRLITLLLRLGDRRGAQKAYAEYAERLRREDDAEPEPETRALVEPSPPSSPPRPSPSRASPPVMPAVSSAVPPTRPRRLWTWVAAAAAILLSVVGARLAWKPPRPSPLSPAVAVFPVAVRGHPELNYLREGLIDLLAARIDGVGGLRVIDPNATLGLAGDSVNLDPVRGAALARQLGATYFVIGDAVEIAGRLQLTAGLYATALPGVPLAKTVSEGEANDIFHLANRAATQLLVGTVPGVDTALANLAGYTTRSPEAFRAYVTGEAALREAHYQRAVDAFQRAVNEDSLFALAHYRLAVAADWVGNQALGESSAIAAVRLGDRLSPLARSMLSGFLLYSVSDGDSAEQVYQRIATAHPDNLEARYMLGEVHFHYNSARGRPFTEARSDFEHVLRIDPDHPHALIHLARIAAAQGHHGELDSLVTRFLALRPDADRALEVRALRAFSEGSRVEEDRVVTELRNASDAVVLQVYQSIAALTADPAGAARLATLLDAPARGAFWHMRSLSERARLAVARGRWTDAREQIQAIERAAPDFGLLQHAALAGVPRVAVPDSELAQVRGRVVRWQPNGRDPYFPMAGGIEHRFPRLRAYLLGTLAAKSRSPTELRQWADTLDHLPAVRGVIGYSIIAHDAAHSLRAAAAWLGGDPRSGLGEVDQIPFGHALLPLNHPEVEGYDRFLRAELLHQMGRDDEALQWYASFPSPSAWDIAFVAPAELRQAQILQHRGDLTASAEHYRRFVTLWDNCDSALIPVVDSARAALALMGQPAAPR